MLGSLVFTFNLEGLLEFMFGAFIFTGGSENESPDDPIICVFRLLLDAFSDFLDSFHDIAFFKLGEGPMHVSVVTIPVELLGLAADVECFFVDHVHVEEESKVVVSERMCVVK